MTAANIVSLPPQATAGGKMGEADLFSTATTGSALEIDFGNGYFQSVLLMHNVSTLTFAGLPPAGGGRSVIVDFVQDATGSRTVAFGTVNFDGGIAPVLSFAPLAIDRVAFEALNAPGGLTMHGHAVGLEMA